MNNLRAVTILTLGLLLFGQSSIAKIEYTNKSETKNKKKYANRRLLVRHKESASLNKMSEAHFSVGAYVIKSFDIPQNTDLVEVAKGISIDAALEYYREDPNVLYAEPDYVYHAIMQPAPNTPLPWGIPDNDGSVPTQDPEFSRQWALHNTGQNGGIPGVDINASGMWDGLPGDEEIIIGVIDTGVNYKHKGLEKNVWRNSLEIPNNGIDDDDNNIVDDEFGADFSGEEGRGDPMDDHGHGTHCAGIIAERGGDNFGGSGINPFGKVIACKFLSATGSGTASGAIECLRYFRDLKTRSIDPVNIIATSNSWGGGPPSLALEDAIREHQELGILFIAAASNDGANNDEIEAFPSDYSLANVIAVAATDSSDNLADFSNYGKRSVHVGAPGVDIWSTTLNNDYESMDGTSMATPFVAGLVGMIKAFDPSLNPIQIKNLLIAGGVKNPNLEGKTISGRRIKAVDENGFGSLTCKNQIVNARLSPAQSQILIPVGEKVMLSAININCADANGTVFIPVTPSGPIVLADNGLGLDSAANDGVYTEEWIPRVAGRYDFMFPNNDLVVINVYDPAAMKTYEASSELFSYRTFEGTALRAADDWSATIPTPFPVKFGGGPNGFDNVNVDSNGVMSVTNTRMLGFNNLEFPIPQTMSLIAPFWDDLNPGAFGGDIYIATLGSAPQREFVVEWRNVRHYSSAQGATFQVVFFEDSSDILFNYLNVELGGGLESKGGSATVGIQTSPDNFVMTSYNVPNLSNKQSIRYKLVQ